MFFFRIIKLRSFLYIFTAHICGCLWFFIANWQISKGKTDTWINNHHIYGKHWSIQYLESLYYATLTMITASSFNIHSPIEKIFSLFIVLALSFIFAYLVNTIGTILNQINKEKFLDKVKIKIYYMFHFNQGQN